MVVHRVGVRHAGNRRESAGDGGSGAGRHRLLVRLPRLAQMDMHVDEAGTDDETGRHLDDGGAVDRKVPSNRGNRAIRDQDVARAIDCLRGIDDLPSLQKDRALVRRQLGERHGRPPFAALPASK